VHHLDIIEHRLEVAERQPANAAEAVDTNLERTRGGGDKGELRPWPPPR
jgi:hypothetical protein